ncbi:ATP-binding protein [Aliarcobacter butzleri]|uniref:ATP-binding protein n=1 Tax=Aliarcobacter butzleri TaxID=28197 RepID=UPI003AFA0184
MKEFTIDNIHNDLDGFNKLVNFYSESKSDFLEEIQLNITTWFDANLSSLLGAILDRLQNEWNEISFNIPKNDIQLILQKNDFLTHFGYEKRIDTYSTTVKYLKLEVKDGRFFTEYIENLLKRPEFPKISSILHEKIAQSIFEIFVNSQIHSKTINIYTCGQFKPSFHELNFTIVDTGIGFAKSIENNLQTKLSDTNAIKWALKEGHTTKLNAPGGIGLAILKEFILQNNGRMQILTGTAFYECSNLSETYNLLDNSFDGTLINMVFKTNDETLYDTIDKIEDLDIF